MKPTLSRTHFDTASQMESLCRERLHALVRGEFSEDEFISEFATVPEHIAESEWDLAEWIHRQHNSGQVPDALFHSLESKIAQLGSDDLDTDAGDTAELYPLGKRRRRPPAFIEGPNALSRRVIEPGAVLRDRYLIEARLGTGGMGTVYKALDKFRSDLADTNRHVAIKILNDDITNRPEVFAKLRREFYCAQSLSHRNIVRVYELDRDGDLAFFTMEFLEGELLSKIIERFAPGTVTRTYAWRVVREVGAALTHAHARDVVHADLKPQNVLITHSGDVRLLDFGTSSANVRSPAASADAPDGSRAGPTALTPAYASCELLEGRRPDPRDDLFAFACLTYEILTGAHPFEQRRSTEARALGMTPRRPDNIGEQQWKMLSLGLAFNRAERSMSVRDWVLAINQPDEVPALLETQPVLTRAAPVDTQPLATRASSAADATPPVGAAAGDAAGAAAAIGMPVPVGRSARDVLVVDVQARPVPSPPSAARGMLLGLLVLSLLMIWAVARRPGAQAPVSAATPQAAAPLPAVVPTPTPAPGPAPEPAAAVAAAAAPVRALPTPALAAPAPPVVAAIPVATPATRPAARPAATPVPATAPAPAATTPAAAKAVIAAKPAAAPVPNAVPAIGIERAKYWVRPGRHFAEVRVIRSAGTRGDANFVWWTEAGSARADEDFFSQAKTTQTFSAGVRTATLFVRIVPNPARRAPRTFYVAIGSPSTGHALGGLTRVPVVVLPRGR